MSAEFELLSFKGALYAVLHYAYLPCSLFQEGHHSAVATTTASPAALLTTTAAAAASATAHACRRHNAAVSRECCRGDWPSAKRVSVAFAHSKVVHAHRTVHAARDDLGTREGGMESAKGE